MPAGELRERVAFDKRAAASDGYGNEEGDFAEQFTRAARIQPKLGGEQVLASRLVGVQPFIIRVRYDSMTATVTEAWRIRDARNGAQYAIRSKANVDERRRYIDFLCETGVAI